MEDELSTLEKRIRREYVQHPTPLDNSAPELGMDVGPDLTLDSESGFLSIPCDGPTSCRHEPEVREKSVGSSRAVQGSSHSVLCDPAPFCPVASLGVCHSQVSDDFVAPSTSMDFCSLPASPSEDTEMFGYFPWHFGKGNDDYDHSEEYYNFVQLDTDVSEEPLEDDDTLPFTSTSVSKKNLPLYNGAQISVWESLTSILAFVQSEHISGAGLGWLLSLIDLHLPHPNNFFQSKTALLKLLEHQEGPTRVHYFCSICYKSRASSTDLCDICVHENRSVEHFLSFPLVSQIKRLFKNPKFVEGIKYKDKCKEFQDCNIRDVYDGEVYRENEGVSDCIQITLNWNSDGLQVYNSSSYSIWPFYLVVNELSPDQRFLSENMIIGGIWGSVSKPHPNVYLQPIYKDLLLLEQGISATCYGTETEKKIQAKCLCGTCDAPARAMFLNMKSHSGFYSCPACLCRGEKPGDAVVFPFQENFPLRTQDLYNQHVEFAVKNQVLHNQALQNEERCCGIKGPTVLSHLVPNIFECTAIDSMHCVYLGVMRQMLHLWFDKDYKEEQFSIHGKIRIVNARLQQMTPPHFIQRMPQSIDKLVYWKASELRSFLVNLSIALLSDILDDERLHHLALFVQGVALLNTNCISLEDLRIAKLLLMEFVEKFGILYGPRCMSHNVHMLLHLERSVRKLGPLWATSCFKFEDMNGRLTTFIHGTRHAGLQIFANLSVITQLPSIVSSLKEGAVKRFCKQVLNKRMPVNITEKISGGIYCVGSFLNAEEAFSWVSNECEQQEIPIKSLQFFHRLLKRHLLYVAASYTRGKHMSSYVKYIKGNEIRYGEIQVFIRAKLCCSCHEEHCSCPPVHYAVIDSMNVTVAFNKESISVRHVYKCQPMSCSIDIVPIDMLQMVMYKIQFNQHEFYLSETLNNFELE